MKKTTYHTTEISLNDDFSFEERLAAMRKMGQDAEATFKIKYNKINNWFNAEYDPLYILSFCMRYFLMNEEGHDEEAETGSLSFPPHYLEILQAVALCHKRVFSDKPLWEDIEVLLQDMKEIGNLINSKLYNLPDSIQSESQLHAYQIRTDVIGYNLAVRNWAYYFQMQKVSEDLAVSIQQAFFDAHNVDPVLFVRLLFAMSAEMERRVNVHLQKLHRALRCEDYISIQKAYQLEFDNIQETQEGMERLWLLCEKDLDTLRALLMAHSDLKLSAMFTFSINEMRALSANIIQPEALGILMNKLSYSFADLSDHNQSFMILDNPVHNKPFIKVDDGSYFTSLWTTIPHLVLSILENLTSESQALKEKYNKQRAIYLEDQLKTLFIEAFPDAEVYAGCKFEGNNGDIYENDLLVISGAFAIVVEAKSGAITKPAKRGAPERLFKTLKELIEEPSEQALRFIDYLKRNKRVNINNKNESEPVYVETDKIRYFIPLGVTFYHLGTAATNLKLLIEGGICNKQIQELAPSISLTDLQIIFKVLPTEAEKIHYLHRRREFETQVKYFADELDLLGFYLETGFNIGDKEIEPNWVFNLSLQSKILDPYFNTQRNEVTSPVLPKMKITPWWAAILKRIKSVQSENWLEISYILLNMNEGDQEELETLLNELISKMRKKQLKDKHNWVTFRTANKERQFAISVYPYLQKHRDERDGLIDQIMDTEYDINPKIKGMITIGINIDKGHYPYSVMKGYLSEKLFNNLFSNMIK